ncbi:hypothetical protein HJC23_008432 [Cyclotella cryptica]|uniref:Uncharacterized protein n=1 Tax=Cyclotella cryptica TaxID=29204 RepID=A0ABD3Q2P3_9STRA
MKSISVFVLACLRGSGGQCTSYNQINRRFGLTSHTSVKKFSSFPSFAIAQPACSISNYSTLARGGDISDAYDEGYEDEFSHLIASFESELFEIRREAEMETEVEMKKILGLVDKTPTRDDVEDMKAEPEDEQITQNEGMENSDDGNESDGTRTHSDPVQTSTTGPVIEVNENMPVDNEQFDDGEELTDENAGGNEQNKDVENVTVTLQDERTTDYSHEKQHDDISTVELHQRQQHSVVCEEILQHPVKSDRRSTNSVDIEVNINGINSRSKRKSKRSQKTKRKKTGVKSMKQRKIIPDSSQLSYRDQTNKSHGYGLSPLSITPQKDIRAIKRGFRYYLQTDLVRTLILFLATIALSILMQRARREMEAKGI